MCQATVYVDNEKIMEDVTSIQITPEGIQLSTFFEAPKLVRARIREIDLLKHRVWLDTIAEPEATAAPEQAI
jgi:predicted RNA-binding protein